MSKIPGFRSGKTWKKVVATIGYLFIILIVVSIAKGGGSSSSTPSTAPAVKTDTAQPASTPAPAAQPAAPAKNKDTITKAEFDQVQNGMTYDQVVAIIGGPGEMLSESGTKGDQFHTVIYSYKGEGDLGANANFTFQGEKLQNKAQMGLK